MLVFVEQVAFRFVLCQFESRFFRSQVPFLNESMASVDEWAVSFLIKLPTQQICSSSIKGSTTSCRLKCSFNGVHSLQSTSSCRKANVRDDLEFVRLSVVCFINCYT